MSYFARFVYASAMWQARNKLQRAKRSGAEATRLETGRRGETLAYWYLRARGYTMVARNLRMRPDTGELDLVGWDNGVLAFVEVKTRSSLDPVGLGESIRQGQRYRIARAAALYRQRLKRRGVSYRFDAVSVVWDQDRGYELALVKDAFRPSSVS